MAYTANKTLMDDVLEATHAALLSHSVVRENDYLDEATFSQLEPLTQEAQKRSHYAAIDAKARPAFVKDSFEAIARRAGALDDAQANRVSRLLALDSIAVNAAESGMRASVFPLPKERIQAYLKEHFSNTPDTTRGVAALQEGLDNLVISLVGTTHPTIYHTPAARRFEARFSELLEQPENVHTATGSPRLSERGKEAVRALIQEAPQPQDQDADSATGFIARLARGEATITPKHQMTVTRETLLEKDNFRGIRKALETIASDWNAALASLEGLSDADRALLTIDDARRKKIFELRAWGQSADADGRDKSTSQFLYESIQRNRERGDDEIFDLRQNASVHRDFISSLIQVKFRNSSKQRYGEDNGFFTFCHDFMANRTPKYEEAKKSGNGPSWDGPEYSIFQQLSPDDRADFITGILTRGDDLVPEQIRKDALEFNAKIFPLKQAFLARYADYIRDARDASGQLLGLDPETIDYKEMIHVSIPYRLDAPDGDTVSLRAAWNSTVKLNGWEILHSGLQYNRNLGMNPPPEPILDFWEHVSKEELQAANYLQGTRKLVGTNGNGAGTPEKKAMGQEELNERERAILMDTIKRMFVLNHAIDGAPDQTIATRYTIANFSEAADFLIAVKLFQEAGLTTLENGKVTQTKIGVMPLLETLEDLDNARPIFEKLLGAKGEDTIAKSFWQARGTAEIMLGFSDGGATAGNFGAQWKIYNAARSLSELFAEHGIKVRFFQGRGRGMDRGGSDDPALHAALMPPEATCRGIYDATIQADLPMDLAASQAYGAHYFTSILLSTLSAYHNGGEARTRLDGLEGGSTAPTRDACESVIDQIAGCASKLYNDIVRNNPQALQFLQRMPDHPYRSSRAAARGDSFDKVRAITKEYEEVGGAKLPVKNVGLKEALDEAAKHTAFAQAMQHPFTHAMLQTVRAGMQDYDPVVAHAYGAATKTQNYVGKANASLSDLVSRLDYYYTGNMDRASSAGGKWQTLAMQDKSAQTFQKPSQRSVLDQVASGMIIGALEKGKLARPNTHLPAQQQWGDTLYNLLFTNAQEVSKRKLVWEREQAPAASVPQVA